MRNLAQCISIVAICIIYIGTVSNIYDEKQHQMEVQEAITLETQQAEQLDIQRDNISNIDNTYKVAELKMRIAAKKMQELREKQKQDRIDQFNNNMDIIAMMPDSFDKYTYIKAIEAKYPDMITVSPNSIYDDFTDEEIYLICRVVESETYDADFGSKSHVAEVIFNRLDSGGFGKNVTQIITSSGQFYYKRTNISPDTLLAVEYAYQYDTDVENALYFQRAKRKKWRKSKWITSDLCGHNFYG